MSSPSIHASLSSASNILHCFIDFRRPVKDIQITIEPKSFTISKKNRIKANKITKYEFDSIELKPDTCRGLKYMPGGEIHFSVQLSKALDDERLVNIHTATSSHQNNTVERIQLVQNHVYCVTCHQKLLSDRCFFTRVLPLPSENWSDFADICFCHNHGDNGTQKSQGRLLPKSKECFVGDTYLLLDKGNTNMGVFKLTPGGNVVCRRCGNLLGLAIEMQKGKEADGGGIYKLFIHTLLLKDLSLIDIQSSTNNRGNLEGFFSQFLQEQSHMYTSYRFIIDASQSSHTDMSNTDTTTSTCLLWLLDPCVTIYRPEPTNGRTDMVGVKQMKVMFKCQLKVTNKQSTPDYVTKTVISLWKKDNTVHGLTLPHPLFLQLVAILIHNTNTLPKSQRIVNDFMVSFISCGSDVT